MLIQLKESEIKIALQNYIVAQGISLVGKTVDISFTAGRKESGISADLDIIEDTSVGTCADAALCQSANIPAPVQVTEMYLTKVEGAQLQKAEAPQAAAEDDTPPFEVAPKEAEAAPAATSSLFG